MTFKFKEEKMRNKEILSLTLILLLGLLLAACSGAATPAPAQPATQAPAATKAPAAEPATEAQAAAAPAATEAPAATGEAAAGAADCAEPVTIEFWHINTQDDRKAVIQQAVDAFEKDNPCVKVNQTILEN